MILWIEDIARVTVNDVEEFTGGIWKFIFVDQNHPKKPPKSHFDASNQLGNIFVFYVKSTYVLWTTNNQKGKTGTPSLLWTINY